MKNRKFDLAGIVSDLDIKTILLARELFEKIISLPESERARPKKERTGIKILVREPESINFFIVSIKGPSDATQLIVVEKAVRSWTKGYPTSGTNADPEKFEFAGSITHKLESMYLQVSTSGLSAEEDTTVSIIIMHRIFGVGMEEIFKYIAENNGELPKEYKDENHYLSKLLKEYDTSA